MIDTSAAVALKIAETAAVTYLLKKAENALDERLTKEMSLPETIKTGIKKFKSELELMTAFLKDMDARRKNSNLIEVWIRQLRDVAYDIEVVLEMFAYQNAQQNGPWYSRSSSRNGSQIIATLIQEIDKKLESIGKKWVRYPIDLSYHPAPSPSDHESRTAALYTPEGEIVGFEEPREELAYWTLDVEKAYQVMFVVGMGGSGKTALVKLVYKQLKRAFDCHVWLTASKFEKSQELMSTMVDKLCNQTGRSPSISSPTHVDLTEMLNNYLQDKRYLIVLDDLWNIEIWESVIHALPKDNCSRVIITTRRGDIASSCRENSVDVYKVQPLPFEKARELFYRTAFHENGMNSLAPGLPVSSEKLLNVCEGLPLGIIKVGKVLSREKSEFEFQKLHDSIQAELDSGRLSSIKQVLQLSYDELPPHLKYCFLYMSMFPQDYFVKRRTLIRLWIAEGFVTGVNGKQLEDIGEEYLKELMERNLIQASELDFDGRPRTCRVHNIVHKIALSISEAESFCTVRKDLMGDISGKARRLSIQSSKFNIPDNIMCHSCTIFASSIGVKVSPQIGSSLKLLKILHLEGANVDKFPPGISELLLLKYLCLSNTRIKQIPKTIGRLQLLQTLNLKQTFVTELPDTIDKLEKLRHLLVCYYDINCYLTFDAVQGFKAPADISKLTNMQKLSFVRAAGNHKLIHDLRYLTQLRKLGIIDLQSTSGPFLCETIQMLTNLHSLNMTSSHRNEVLEIQEINSTPPFLERLYLKGKLEKMPHWISKLHNLVRLRLKWSRLTHDNNPIKFLEGLPNLLELQLLDAYTGHQLDFGAGTFLKLKILEFTEMEKLETVMIDNGALPCLQKLIISRCQRLRQIPAGIDNVTQLKELHLSDLPADFVDPLRRYGRMRHLVQHIQKIYSRHLQDGCQWVWEDLS